MTEKLSHKERTRARILDEAAKMLREHGSEGIGVAALMKRAGLTHGGFYAHFENRDELIERALERMRADNHDMMTKLMDQRCPSDGVSAVIDYYLSEVTALHADRACPLPVLAQEAGRMPGAARSHLTDVIRSFRDRLARAFSELGAREPAALAASVLSEMVGAVTLARALGDGDEARELLLASGSEIKRRIGLDHLAIAS